MIGYYPHGSLVHPFASKDAREVIRVVERMLVQSTDCQGPMHVVGIPSDRLGAVLCVRGDGRSTLAPLVALIDELVRDRRPCRVELKFELLLRVPDDYPPSRALSTLSLRLHHANPSAIMPSLWWPYDTVTEAFLRSHDDVFGELGIATYAEGWRLGEPGRLDNTPFEFDRSVFTPPPDDEVGRRLHDEVLANPGDAGARLAYGDWLSERDDPLGEMLVLQVELASATGARSAALDARATELLARYGLRWPRELVPREDPPSDQREMLLALGLHPRGHSSQ